MASSELAELPFSSVCLPLLLAATAGFADACAYLSFGVYAANMTGNAISVATKLTGGGTPTQAWARACPIIAFFCGSLIGAGLGPHNQSVPPARRRRVRRVLAVEAVLLVAVAILGRTVPLTPIGGFDIRLALLAIALGVQNAAIRRAGSVSFRTTHMTGRLTRAAEEALKLLRLLHRTRGDNPDELVGTGSNAHEKAAAARRLAFLIGLFILFIAGACAGTFALAHLGLRALLFPAAGLAIVASAS